MQGRLGTATLLHCLWSKLCVAQADHRTPRSGVSKAGNYQRRIHLVILGMTQWWLTCCFPITRTTRTSSELAAVRGKGAFPRPGCSANWTSGGSTGAMSCSNPMDRTGMVVKCVQLCTWTPWTMDRDTSWNGNRELGLREFQPHFSDRLATRGQGGCVKTESLGRWKQSVCIVCIDTCSL